MNIVRFENTMYLYYLLGIPIFIILMWVVSGWRKSSWQEIGLPVTINKLSPDMATYKHQIKFILWLVATSLIVLALSNLQLGSKLEKVKRSGIDLVIAIDVSKSMLAEDLKPNRLSRAKRFVSGMIKKLQNDRIAIIIFAGNAYLQMPLTIDYAAAKMYLKSINTNIVPTQGTAISEAIKLANESFVAGEQKHKALVIITDGEDHEEGSLEIAQVSLPDMGLCQ